MRHVLVLALVACNESRLVPDPVAEDPGTDTNVDPDPPDDTDLPAVEDADGDGSPDDLDCDDVDPAVFPGAPDLCGDDAVTDCDRTSDDGLVTLDGVDTYDDLRAALRDAAPNAEIRVCPGAYAGPFVGQVPVRIVAHGDATDTILDGLGQGPTLTVRAGTELVGLTITGGDTTQKGGGVQLSSPGTLLLEACVVTGNHARFGGGLATGPQSVVTLVDTEVRGNDAVWNGGGALIEAGSTLDLSAGSTVSSNFADQGGGGVAIESGLLVGGTVDRNETNVFGGGVQVLEGTVEGTVIDANIGGTGGGVYVEGAVVLRDLAITANEGGFGAGIAGGAYLIYVENALTVVGCEIGANQAEFDGGGIYADSAVDVDGAVITDNTARNGAGVWVSGPVTMSGGSLVRNVATRQGGGVFIRSAGPQGALFDADGVDLGSGADDNTPVNVTTGRNGDAEYVGYGASATVSCDETACDPTP